MNLELWLNTWAPRTCAAVEFALYTSGGQEARYPGYAPQRITRRGDDNQFAVHNECIAWPYSTRAPANAAEVLRYVGVRFLDVLDVCIFTSSFGFAVPITMSHSSTQPVLHRVTEYPIMLRCGPWLGE